MLFSHKKMTVRKLGRKKGQNLKENQIQSQNLEQRIKLDSIIKARK